MTPSLHTLRAGRQGAPTILFLHGFLGSSNDWKKTMQDFQSLETPFYCLAPDLPGHGRSVDVPCSFEGMTAMLADLLVQERVTRCSIVGYSMGGRIALDFMARTGFRPEKLVLVSSQPGLNSDGERAARALADDALAARLEQGPLEEFLSGWYNLPLFQSLKKSPGLKASLLAQRGQNDSAALAKALRAFTVGRQVSCWPLLHSLEIPVLAVCGAEDEVYRAIMQRLAQSCPKGRLALIPDAGHAAHLEKPDAFFNTLRTFLV